MLSEIGLFMHTSPDLIATYITCTKLFLYVLWLDEDEAPLPAPPPAQKVHSARPKQSSNHGNQAPKPARFTPRPHTGKMHQKIAVDQHIIYNQPEDSNNSQSSQQQSSGQQALPPANQSSKKAQQTTSSSKNNLTENFIRRVGHNYECIACSAKCTSAGEMERHKEGRRHRLGVIAYQLKKQR